MLERADKAINMARKEFEVRMKWEIEKNGK